MSDPGKGTLRYKYTEEESGFAGTTVTSQSQNSHRSPLKPLLFPGVLAFLASSAIHQSLSILLIISTAEHQL